MKNFKVITFLLFGLIIFSCQTEEIETELSNENQELITEEVLAKLTNMGFDITNYPVRVSKEGYTVEEDILIPREEVERRDISSKQRYLSVMTCSNARNVRIQNSLPPGVARRAYASAINSWNAVGNSLIRLVNVTSNPDIIVRSDNGSLPSNVLGQGEFPSGGRAGGLIIINTSLVLNVSQWRSTIQHEIGHNIGFSHTNMLDFGNPISGTPRVDDNSLMNGGRGGTVRNLTTGDKNALRALYGRNNASSICN